MSGPSTWTISILLKLILFADMLHPKIGVRLTPRPSRNSGYTTFRTPEMAPLKRPKSITGRKDDHRKFLYLTLPLVRCRGFQPTGLICHVEVFRVPMTTEENPAQVTDLAVSPSSNPACTLRIYPQQTAQSESDDHR